ncbi:MAG: Bax inhibitor-1/YccA family protein [Bacilli bacterium]|nr:Bax inhibitor-1/YccA family protein [Bacilli bacterium]
MRQSSNPVFRNMQKNVDSGIYSEVTTKTASWGGIISKTIFLVLLTIAAGVGSFFIPEPVLLPLILVGAFGSAILVFFAMIFPKGAMVLSMLYAIFQGLLYGTLTGMVNFYLPGVGMMALVGTFAIVGVMAFLHAIGAVRATPFLVRFVMGALISILIGSIVLLIIRFAAPDFHLSILNNYPLMIIVFSALVILGAIMLIIDFDNAKNLVASGAPKMYEWQVGLGILVTVIWIYLQILRLLVVIMGNRR